MSKQKHYISDSQKWAIWTVYSMKCFWCKNPLEFSSCRIDCVVPLTTSKIVLRGLVKDFNLGDGFSLSSYENYVAACEACVSTRAKAKFKPTQIPFKLIRETSPFIEAKVTRINAEPSGDRLLRQLVEKLERGEITPETLKSIVEPFLNAVEGSPKTVLEFRLNKSIRLLFNQEGVRMQPLSEIRYENLVDGLVESTEWMEHPSEQINDGPTFGEGRKRKRL